MATQHPKPKARPPHAGPKPDIATPQQFAAMTFEPWPEAIAAVGTGTAWAAQMAEKAFPLVLGMHTLSFDDVALTAKLRDGRETALTLADWLDTQAAAFRGLAGFCETAQTRLMCVLSRLALEMEAATGVQS